MRGRPQISGRGLATSFLHDDHLVEMPVAAELRVVLANGYFDDLSELQLSMPNDVRAQRGDPAALDGLSAVERGEAAWVS